MPRSTSIHSVDGAFLPLTFWVCHCEERFPSTDMLPSWAESWEDETVTGWFNARLVCGTEVGVGDGISVGEGVKVGGGVEVGAVPAQLRAERRSRRPYPNTSSGPEAPKSTAVLINACFCIPESRLGYAESSRASPPATCGDARDVPVS